MAHHILPDWHIPENQVTPEKLYLNRRQLVAGLALAPTFMATSAQAKPAAAEPTGKKLPFSKWAGDLKEKPAPWDVVTSYNNFYEFGVKKDDPVKYAHDLTTDPWSITVEGECGKPGTYGIEDLVDFKALQERIYRLRCVEAWSMVIPWVGVPLGPIIQKLEPNSDAKFIQFVSKLDREEMRGTRFFPPVLDWPYVEGLRMDEAMNDLTLMTVGLYGRVLPKQSGAPIRIVVPWKYGFKSIKSIDKIRFVKTMPKTSWNEAAPREYGFYSNVNPHVDHPRWSQATERVLGGPQTGFASVFARRDTEMFNGYGAQVADLYKGMDLKKYF